MQRSPVFDGGVVVKIKKTCSSYRKLDFYIPLYCPCYQKQPRIKKLRNEVYFSNEKREKNRLTSSTKHRRWQLPAVTASTVYEALRHAALVVVVVVVVLLIQIIESKVLHWEVLQPTRRLELYLGGFEKSLQLGYSKWLRLWLGAPSL